MNKKNRDIVIITLFALALALPFSNKAYHIDDTAFLYIANQILKDPLRPYSFNLEWASASMKGTDLLDTPLVPYYISFISWVFGRSEIVLHISFVVFHIIAGLSFYFLARKFIPITTSLLATLIMLSTPTFLANSQNLMLDVPMYSLFLLSIALFVYGLDKEKHSLLLLGSLAAGFAYLTKPNAIILIPLLMLYCFIKKKPRYMFYLIIPIFFVVLFAVHNYFFEDKVLLLTYIPFLSGAKQSSFNILIAYFFSNLSYIGGAAIFPLFYLYPFVLKKKNLILLKFSIFISAIISLLLYNFSSNFVSGKYTIFQTSVFFVFTASSMFFILLVVVENYKYIKSFLLNVLYKNRFTYDSDKSFIFLWFIGIYVLNSGLSGGAVRYNTLFLPPLILSYFILLHKYSKSFRINIFKLSFFVFLITVLTGVIVAYADYEYANSYRDFVSKVPAAYKTDSNTLHFIGSAGFQYYMDGKGYRMLLRNDNSPKKGDIIIKANLAFPRMITPELRKRIELVDVISYDGRIPVRTQNTDAHAGYYTYAAGFLPYSFSNAKLETFEVYYVR